MTDFVSLPTFSGITDGSPASPSYLNSKFTVILSQITAINQSLGSGTVTVSVSTVSAVDVWASSVSASAVSTPNLILSSLSIPGAISASSISADKYISVGTYLPSVGNLRLGGAGDGYNPAIAAKNGAGASEFIIEYDNASAGSNIVYMGGGAYHFKLQTGEAAQVPMISAWDASTKVWSAYSSGHSFVISPVGLFQFTIATEPRFSIDSSGYYFNMPGAGPGLVSIQNHRLHSIRTQQSLDSSNLSQYEFAINMNGGIDPTLAYNSGTTIYYWTSSSSTLG